MSAKKDLKKILDSCEEAGYVVVRTKNSHLQVRCPITNRVIAGTGSTPGGGNRALMNFRLQLRRGGVPGL